MDLLTNSKSDYWVKVVELFVESRDIPIANLNSNDRCKIILVDNCQGQFTLNNNSFNFSSPFVLCLNQNDVVRFNATTIKHMTCLYFHPRVLNDLFEFEFLDSIDFNEINTTARQDAILLNTFYNLDVNMPNRYDISIDKYLQLKKLINNIDNELLLQYDGYWPCRSRSYFIELIININQLYYLSKDTGNNLNNNIANEITEYLTENISENITLSQITKKYLMNRNKLNDIVKEKTGMTAIQFLNSTRIKIASYLIANTTLAIKEIAGRVGYENVSDFSNFFKKNVGTSPRNYRIKTKC